MTEQYPQTYAGGCHCGAVRLRVEVDATPLLYACNCSMCERVAYLHLIVNAAAFTLLQGEDALTLYQFNTAQAKHWFCRYCGVKPYYVPRSHPDGFSVNARCLDDPIWRQWPIQAFDGRQWEHAATQFE